MTKEPNCNLSIQSSAGITDMRLLVVDDDTELRNLLGDYLRKNGYHVSLAADGKDMRKILADSAIDLIVLD